MGFNSGFKGLSNNIFADGDPLGPKYAPRSAAPFDPH